MQEVEVKYFGQIKSGSLFPVQSHEGIMCQMQLDIGQQWEVLESDLQNQIFCSQISYSDSDDERIWNLPISLNLSSLHLNGWPSLIFKIWKIDQSDKLYLSNQCNIVSYGTLHLPKQKGYHVLQCETWTLKQTFQSNSALQLDSPFLNRNPQISNDDLFQRQTNLREHIGTVSSGIIHVELEVIQQ